MIITIDGPTASGKSTLAQKAAERLNIYYLNTGYLYRAIGHILSSKYGYGEQQLSTPAIEHLNGIIDPTKLTYSYATVGAMVTFNNNDITPFLKTPLIDRYASIISSNPIIRNMVLPLQHAIARQHSVVVEGRDCGTVVFPQADFKFFLTADISIRAQRWQKSQKKRGIELTFEECIAALDDRDQRDITREHCPLKIAENGIIIDSTNLSPEELLNYIIHTITQKKIS